MSEARPSYEAGPRGAGRGGAPAGARRHDLEESLALWERGEKLAQVCQDWLDGAQRRLDAAIAGDEADGPTTASGPSQRSRAV